MILNEILDIITKNISEDKVLRECRVKEFKVKSYEKAVYKNGREYSGLVYELVFLVDTGEWFDETIRFELRINDSNYSIKYKKNYAEDYIEYDKADYKLVIKEIINSIYEFSRKDIFNERYLKEII